MVRIHPCSPDLHSQYHMTTATVMRVEPASPNPSLSLQTFFLSHTSQSSPVLHHAHHLALLTSPLPSSMLSTSALTSPSTWSSSFSSPKVEVNRPRLSVCQTSPRLRLKDFLTSWLLSSVHDLPVEHVVVDSHLPSLVQCLHDPLSHFLIHILAPLCYLTMPITSLMQVFTSLVTTTLPWQLTAPV